jgi:hypothetical protein
VAATRKSEAPLSESEASQVIALLKDVDSVELKLRSRAGNRQLMPAREYRLTLEGELSDEAGRAVEGMTLARENGLTVLSGCLRDQAELRGLLQRPPISG